MFLGSHSSPNVRCILHPRACTVLIGDCVIANCWDAIAVLYVGIGELRLGVNVWGL